MVPGTFALPIMEQAIEAYRHISKSDRLREIQRMRDKARVNESYAILNEREKWQGVIAEKDAMIAENKAMIAELKAQLQNR